MTRDEIKGIRLSRKIELRPGAGEPGGGAAGGFTRDGVEIHPDSTFEFLCFAGKPTLTCLDGIVLVMSSAVRDLIFDT